MDFRTWDTLFNLLAFVFWLRIWNADDRALVFNPYLQPLDRLGRFVLHYLDPLGFGLSRRAVAALTVLAVIVLRGLLVPSHALWIVNSGVARIAATASAPGSIAFSAVSFLVFCFRVWGVALVYEAIDGFRSRSPAAYALHVAARPFSDVPPARRPALLLVAGMALAVLIDRVGVVVPYIAAGGLPVHGAVTDGSAAVVAWRLLMLGLGGWVQILPVLRQVVFLLIIGSIIGAVTASYTLLNLTREWIDLFLGPLRRVPLRIGMFDLTPLLFFFLLGLLHGVLMSVLAAALTRLT